MTGHYWHILIMQALIEHSANLETRHLSIMFTSPIHVSVLTAMIEFFFDNLHQNINAR